ncbi:hypothetical protein [Arthrobacter sp. G119Y2]|uniref:hypothetical protein n=1 Tax=Arthrobacter sp. G119Y2 TaxID=3134965 RepID=UPI00311915ED
MNNVGETKTNRPGSGLIAAGLLIALIGIVIAFLAINSGGSLSVFVGGTILVGFVLAVIGFCRRVLAALESR